MPERQRQAAGIALVLGDFSGRNLGHNALLVSIVTALHEHAGCRSLVPSQDTPRLRRVLADFPEASVVDARPQSLSLKFFGLQTLSALRHADCLVLADNPFYDTALFNPLSNGLAAMGWLAGAAQRRSMPVVCLNAGAGPLRSATGQRLAGKLCRRADLLQARDAESRTLLGTLASGREITVTADSGWAMPWSRIAGEAGLGERRWIGVNLSPEFAGERKADGGDEHLARRLASLAAGVATLAAARGAGVLIVAGHSRDLPLCERLRQCLPANLECRLTSGWESGWTEVAGQCDALECVIGTRYHELLMYASGGVPVLGLDCGEKVPTLMREIGRMDCLFPAAALAEPDAAAVLGRYFAAADASRADLQARVAQLRGRALAGVQAMGETLSAAPSGRD